MSLVVAAADELDHMVAWLQTHVRQLRKLGVGECNDSCASVRRIAPVQGQCLALVFDHDAGMGMR